LGNRRSQQDAEDATNAIASSLALCLYALIAKLRLLTARDIV
jgi:hypothetical protein